MKAVGPLLKAFSRGLTSSGVLFGWEAAITLKSSKGRFCYYLKVHSHTLAHKQYDTVASNCVSLRAAVGGVPYLEVHLECIG